MQTDFYKLDILSPVHIGTGDELDPMNYLMRLENGKSSCCYVLDTQSWAMDFADAVELSKVFSGTNVPAMRGFVANNIDPGIYSRRRIAVSDMRLFRIYEQKLSDQRTNHQLLLSPHITSADKVPLIPGSSIKGSLRTAVIAWLDQENRLGLKAARAKDPKGGEYRKRLGNVFGSISDNAFKQLKISDVPGFSDSTQLVESLEIRRKEGKTATPKNMCEVLPSKLLGQDGQGVLYVKISLGSPLNPSDQHLTLQNGRSWDWQELSALVNNYFRERFQEEKAKFYGLPNFAKARPAIEKIEVDLKTSPGQMIMRVGHYSQVEFVTVRDNQPKTRNGKQGTPLPHGTTRTLANGLYPFGWIKLTPCSETEYRKSMSHLEEVNKEVQSQREKRRAQVLAERIKLREDAKQQAETARLKVESEQRAKEALEALPAEERDVILLERGLLNENKAFDMFNHIDNLLPALHKPGWLFV